MHICDKPALQVFHIEGVKHITPENAAQALDDHDTILLDVREDGETGVEWIPLERVVYHPLSVILERQPYISKEQNIIVVCRAGVRSSKVANLLNKQGYPNVANLDGGLQAWKDKNLPVESILPPECGASCKSCRIDDENGKCC